MRSRLCLSLILAGCGVMSEIPRAEEECVGAMEPESYYGCRLILGSPECEDSVLFEDIDVGLNYTCNVDEHETACDTTGQIFCQCRFGDRERPLWTCVYRRCTFWRCVED